MKPSIKPGGQSVQLDVKQACGSLGTAETLLCQAIFTSTSAWDTCATFKRASYLRNAIRVRARLVFFKDSSSQAVSKGKFMI